MFRVVIRPLAFLAVTCLLLTGCGGGGDGQAPKAPANAAKVQEKSAATGGGPKPKAE